MRVIVDCAAYVGGQRATERLDLDELEAWLAKPDAFVWLGLRMPSRDELAEVAASDDVRLELEEAGDVLASMVQRVHSMSGLLDSAFDANLAQIGIQQNEDMRRISAWVAMAAVPTLLAGIYGMNFDTMPELRMVWGYPFALGLMATIALLMYRGFKRSGWL